MKAFREWQKKRMIKTIGYLNSSSAYNAGEKAGWRAAMKCVLAQRTYLYDEDFIRKELEEE